MTTTVDRGGSFGRPETGPRNWMRAAPPGIARRTRPAESSPVGGGESPRAQRRALSWIAAASVGLGLWLGSNGAYLYTKAALAQRLLHQAWLRTQQHGAPARPWTQADAHPVARLAVPALGVDLLVRAGTRERRLPRGHGRSEASTPAGSTGRPTTTAHQATASAFLGRLSPGDLVVVEPASGAPLHYRVRDATIADQRSARIPRMPAEPTLTLVASDAFDEFAAPPHAMVVATFGRHGA
jgi:sortase A